MSDKQLENVAVISLLGLGLAGVACYAIAKLEKRAQDLHAELVEAKNECARLETEVIELQALPTTRKERDERARARERDEAIARVQRRRLDEKLAAEDC